MINKRILLIYTGGTIGMIKDKVKNTLVPFNFDELLKAIPELKSEEVDLDSSFYIGAYSICSSF